MQQLSVADVLSRAADLIEPEGAWTQGSYAKSALGYQIGPDEPGATCWCAIGAIIRAGGDMADPAEHAMRRYLGHSIVNYNDAKGRAQTEVVAKLREAAAELAKASS